MKVCYFGTYRKNYSRNRIMIAALESAGVDVIQCHETLWHGIQDRVNVTESGWKSPAFWWRVVKTYSKLIWRFFKIKDFDILMVGYPGQFDIFLAKVMALFRRKPLVWDVFMSIYLVAKERSLDQVNSFSVKMIRWFERRALNLPDLLIQDTAEYVAWFHEEYHLSPDRFKLVPTGADDRTFKPIAEPAEKEENLFTVLYYGTFIPNHGVLKIAEAANILRDERDILFEIIGDGPEKELFEKFAQDNRLTNVRMIEWMEQETLLQHISKADICLGAFGMTPQSLMTVQNKIYECLAMGKPVITGESPAVKSALPEEAIVTCSREEPGDLARAILGLKQDSAKRQRLSQNAAAVFNQNYSVSSLGKQLKAYLEAL